MGRTRSSDAPGRIPDAHYSLEKSYLLADEVLKHRALPRTLSSDNGDLGQVQVGVLADGREGILHAVHQRNQVLHSPVAHLGDAPELSVFLVEPGMDLFLCLSPCNHVCPHCLHGGCCRVIPGSLVVFSPSLTVRSPQRGLVHSSAEHRRGGGKG